jgi:phage tail-like protein
VADLDPQFPFTTFNFAIEIQLPDVQGVSQPLCNGAFSECDGLEISFDVKTIREGGNNDRQIRLTGPATLGQLTLKRGMTRNADLWAWVANVQQNPGLRAEATVVMFGSETAAAPDAKARDVKARFVLSRCLPVKIKAPALNAKDGLVAVEELQVAYEALAMDLPGSGKVG